MVMGWYGDHMTGWGYFLMGSSTLAFWVLVVAAVVLLTRSSNGGTGGGSRHPKRAATPDQILAERFARGEIDEEEYRRRLDALRRA
jgi:putative membrane protein